MSRYKISKLVATIIGLVSLTLVALVGFAHSPRSQFIQLTTNPPIGQFYPFEAEATTPQLPVQLTLEARNLEGQLLENSKFKVQILTPPSNPFLSTDFPIVEGTKLLEMEATSAQGKLEFEQMLPIRGKYQFLVNVTPVVGDGTPIYQTLTLDVPENPVKYRNYAILLAILLAVGIGGGWVMGKQEVSQPGEIAPARVRLLLSGAVIVAIASLLVINVSAEMAESHSHHHEHHSSPEKPAVINDSEIKLQIVGDKQATVGETANFQVQALDTKTNLPVKDVVFKIATTQLENNWIAFAYQGIADANGQFKWQQQFFDGATHKLEVEVAPNQSSKSQFQPVVATEEIEVTGVAPPLLTRLIGLTYLVSAIAIGLAIGLWLRRRSLGTSQRILRQV